MSSIIIKELYGSNDILELVEKVNYNFDQLIAAGGGPQGPAGPDGPGGPAGSRGIRGSEWFGADSTTTGTINVPTDGSFKNNDFRLKADGDIQYYLAGSAGPSAPWVNSGLNIKGPAGPAGPAGDGSISIILSNPSSTTGSVVPNGTLGGSYKTLNDHLINAASINDEDDSAGTSGYIDKGLDFAALGLGNNSLVLARYLSMFKDNGTFEPHFSNFPTEESDVPMLIIGQNDYKDPFPTLATNGKDPNSEYTNGIAIGLNKTHPDYDALYKGVSNYGVYDSFTKLAVLNRNFDFGITSVGSINLRSTGANTFRLSAGYSRAEIKTISKITDWSNFFNTDTYTEYNIKDSFAIIGSDNPADTYFSSTTSQFITRYGGISLSSTVAKTKAASYIDNINSTVIGRNANSSFDKNANELIIVNDVVEEEAANTWSTQGTYKKRRQILSKTYDYRNANNYRDTQLRIGQTRIEARKGNQTSTSNVFYLGQGYDTPIMGYSAMNFRIPSGSNPMAYGSTASAYNFLPEDGLDFNSLGYNIADGFVGKDKSLTRLGIFPGFFNQQKDAAGNIDPSDVNKDKNIELYLDEGHKKMPTGSLDLYGTVRIREYGLAENKEGYVAVNGGHGIVKWESPQKVGLPTGSIIMVGEIKMSSFNFFTRTRGLYGQTASGTGNEIGRYSWNQGSEPNGAGGTATYNQWSMAFPGKGSGEFKGYYVCNGAVLADTRDVYLRGAFSTIEGIHGYGSDKPLPGLQDNPAFDYNALNSTYLVRATTGNTFNITTPVGLKNAIKNSVTSINDLYGNDGLSMLAPRGFDSKFRVVLPNYFGRFPKQIFPNSDTIALNTRITYNDGTGVPTPDNYRLNNSGEYIINAYRPLKSGFVKGGFPYLRNENLPFHTHFDGLHQTVQYASGSSSINVIRPLGDVPQIPSGVIAIRRTTGGVTKNERNVYNDRKLERASDEPNAYYMTYDWETYDNSNWKNDTIVSQFRQRTQKFYDPVYKGTYFIINLNGLKNPNRGNTVINDFDFITGVPFSGFKNFDTPGGVNADLSWYANASTVLDGSTDFGNIISAKGRGGQQLHIYETSTGVEKFITPQLGQEAFAEFEVTYRNEGTMHPNTLYRTIDPYTSSNSGETNLEDIYANVYTEPIPLV